MRKFLIINILLVIFLNSFYVCFANENKFELVKYEKTCEPYLKYKGDLKIVHYAFYEKDGKNTPAYCVNPEYSGVNENLPEYSVKINGKIINEKIWKVIINGYPYKTLEELGVNCKEEAYTATQFAIYTVLHNRNVTDYESVGSEAGQRTLNAYLKIMKNVNESNEKMVVDVNVIPESSTWKLDELENNCLSKIYTLKSNFSNGNYAISLKGEMLDKIKITDENGKETKEFKINEKFKILVPIDLLTEEINFEIEVKGKINSKPILLGETLIAETQNYALTGNQSEEFDYKYEDEIPKNITKIKIIKQEKETTKRIQNVKFNLLNSNKDFVIQDLITDENGEIILDDLIPGTYYLQEIEAPDKYNIIEEPIEININLNETVEVTIENSIKEIPKELPEELPEEIQEKDSVEVIDKVIVEPQKTLPVTGY